MLPRPLQDTLSDRWEPSPEDRECYGLFGVRAEPAPSPLLRHLKRAVFQPLTALYSSVSARSGKRILSMYRPESGCAVFSVDEWWDDSWDATQYGRNYDFSSPFFIQFDALNRAVPKLAVFNDHTENCCFSISAGQAKNCYYSNRVYHSENIYYSEFVNLNCFNLCDCLWVQQSSWLYDCLLCFNCENSVNLVACESCNDCFYSIDCVGCSDCLFCRNLRHKSHHIFNQPVSIGEYDRRKAEFINGRSSTRERCEELFRSVWLETVWPAVMHRNSENCTGDVLRNCADCHECYSCVRLSNSRYCWDAQPSGSASYFVDVTGGGTSELLFNSIAIGANCYNLRMCMKCRGSSFLTYCVDCHNCDYCFGCSGLVRKSYCILNKQYTKSQYEELLPRIIAAMERSGEWGLFFPICSSLFGYNESAAAFYLPLEQAEAEHFGFSWRESLADQEQEIQPVRGTPAPDSIDDVPDGITGTALVCEKTQKAYRVTTAELALYRKMNIPIPRIAPQERISMRRRALRPRALWPRACARTGVEIFSSIPPSAPEIVWSVNAYQAELY